MEKELIKLINEIINKLKKHGGKVSNHSIINNSYKYGIETYIELENIDTITDIIIFNDEIIVTINHVDDRYFSEEPKNFKKFVINELKNILNNI